MLTNIHIRNYIEGIFIKKRNSFFIFSLGYLRKNIGFFKVFFQIVNNIELYYAVYITCVRPSV